MILSLRTDLMDVMMIPSSGTLRHPPRFSVMDHPAGRPPCVFPSPSEEDLALIPGDEPGTAIRVRVQPGMGGYVRLEQLAYNADMGWYTQKSFCIPGDMLATLVPQLRKANCLIPATPHCGAAPLVFPGPRIADDQPTHPERREA